MSDMWKTDLCFKGCCPFSQGISIKILKFVTTHRSSKIFLLFPQSFFTVFFACHLNVFTPDLLFILSGVQC